MTTSIRRALALATTVALGLTLSVLTTADAGWANCPSGTTVAYNPTNGHAIMVGYDDQSNPTSARPIWIWVCVDDGGAAGANSVGTANYLSPNGYPAVLQHVVVCPSVTSDCPGAMVGATVYPPQAGAYGATPCLSGGTQDEFCVSVGVTPGSVPGAPAAVSNGPTCVVNVAGVCPNQVVTVQTGGVLLTLYIGGSPTWVTVPAACARTSWTPPILSVQPGYGC